MKTVGLLVNPVAGLGGTVGLHGTDGRELADRALARGAVPRATDRAVMALSELAERTSGFRLLTVSGAMGSCAVAGAGLSATVVYSACDPTGPGDTVAAAVALAEAGCDLLLFAGGDGTARDLLTARPPSAPPTPKPNPAGPATARTKPGPAAAAGPSDPTPASPTPAGPSDGPATTGPLAPLAAGSSGGPTVTGPLAIPGPAEFPYEQSPAGPSGGSVATGPLVAASSAGPTVTQASSGPPFTGRPTSAAESVATATGPSTTLPGPAESRCGPGPDGALDGQAVAGSLAGMMVIGIPAGVKIHSAVYAVNPRAAGEVAAAYCDGTVRSRMAEVLDRPPGSGTGTVLYGHLPVPALPHRVQLGKIGSTSTGGDDPAGLAARLAESRPPDGVDVFGPGTTTQTVLRGLGVAAEPTGVTVIDAGGPLALDADAGTIAALTRDRPTRVVVSPIGGQGFLLGRGNQQLTPGLLRRTGPGGVVIISGEAKLAALGGRPLLVDTGDEEVDDMLSGYSPVLTGRNRQTMYRIGKQ